MPNKNYLEKAINLLTQSEGDVNSDAYKGAAEYFSMHVTQKFNDRFNSENNEESE